MTEMVIQQLLLEAGAADVDQDLVMVDPQAWRSPPTGGRCNRRRPTSATARAAGSPRRPAPASTQPADYTAAAAARSTSGRLSGDWTVARHAAVAERAGARIAFQFHARDVNLVMGPADRGRDDPVPRTASTGSRRAAPPAPMSTPDGRGPLDEQRTYQLIRQPGPIAERRFEIEFVDAGAEAYCFTFG